MTSSYDDAVPALEELLEEDLWRFPEGIMVPIFTFVGYKNLEHVFLCTDLIEDTLHGTVE